MFSIPAFDSAMREQSLSCYDFYWAKISPDVFGSMFQTVKDTEARCLFGKHYITETNILKLIQPLFLDNLVAECIRLGWMLEHYAQFAAN